MGDIEYCSEMLKKSTSIPEMSKCIQWFKEKHYGGNPLEMQSIDNILVEKITHIEKVELDIKFLEVILPEKDKSCFDWTEMRHKLFKLYCSYVVSHAYPQVDISKYSLYDKYLISASIFMNSRVDDIEKKASHESLTLIVQAIEDAFIPNDLPCDIESYTAYKFIDILKGNISVEEYIDGYKSYTNIDEKSVLIKLYQYIKALYFYADDYVANEESSIRMKYLDSLMENHYALEFIEFSHNKFSPIYDKYFEPDTEYLFRTVAVTMEEFKKRCSHYKNEASIEKFLDAFKYEMNYIVIPELMSHYKKEESNDAEKRAIIRSFIYDTLKTSKASSQYKHLEYCDTRMKNYLDEYLTTFAYEGPTVYMFAIEEPTEPALEASSTGLGTNAAKKTQEGKKKVYHAYKKYKDKEEAVDNQLTKMINICKTKFKGDKRTEIIEGKEFSAIGLLKKVLKTSAIFCFSKIGGIIYIVVKYATSKSTDLKERKRIIMEIETELKLLDEKIQDAAGDGNRQAKYAMMRTRAELENALEKIKFGMEADKKSLSTASNVLNKGVSAVTGGRVGK